MKKLLFLTVSVALLRVPGSAAPCVTGTLASYIAMASAGCALGNLTVSGFAYKANAGGGAGEITADQITVTPLLAPVGTAGLQFAAPWSVQAGQEQASGITYQVSSTTTSGEVKEISLDGSGFQAGLLGSVVVQEIVATPAEAASLEVYLKCTEVCRSKTSADAFITASAALVVQDRVTLQSKQGESAMTSFTDWFITCPPCA